MDKLLSLIQKVENSDSVARRTIAKILGKCYSNRLIYFGSKLSLSPMTYYSREFLFKNSTGKLYEPIQNLKKCWFYKNYLEKDIYQQFFDEEVKFSSKAEKKNVISEFYIAYNLCCKQVDFLHVRQNIFTLNELPQFGIQNDSVAIFCDASGDQYGVSITTLQKTGQGFSIAGKILNPDVFSINVKEFASVIYSILLLEYLIEQGLLQKPSSAVVFTDNETSRNLAVSKSVNIRNSTIHCSLV